MGQLWVVRHGQASLFAADYDVLSERGRTQASALGQHFAAHGIEFDSVVCGPAKRQRDTAALCGEAAGKAAGEGWPDPVVIPGLDEHDAFGMLARVVPRLVGDPEIDAHQAAIAAAADDSARSAGFQRLFEAVMKRWLNDQLDPQDAESWNAFRDRVLGALAELTAAQEHARCIAFTSVGPLAVLLQRALGTADLPSFQVAWRIRNASITRFVYTRRGEQLRLTLDGFNALPHLPDPTTWTFR